MLYNIQVYTFDRVYKTTISPALIKTQIQFDGSLNGGQGSLRIALNLPIDDNTFAIGDMVQVYAFTEQNKSGTLLYTGGIKDINRRANTVGEEIEIDCQGLGRLFYRKMFRGGSNELTWTITDTADNIIKLIIDQLNVQFPGNWLSYSEGLIDSYPANITLDLQRTNCQQAMGTIQEITQWDYFIRPDGQVVFRPQPSAPTHILTYKKDIERLEVRETSADLVNRLIFVGNNVDAVFNDATSQLDYGLFEIVETDNNAAGQPSADLAAENIVNKRKNPLREISATINSKYDYTSIYPGDTVAITNTTYPIQNAKVIKVQYRDGRMELGIERYVGIGKKILSLAK